MPDECASMRSTARWVLPVLVGPSTAVTPAPRARTSRLWGAENETGISDRLGMWFGAEQKSGHLGCGRVVDLKFLPTLRRARTGTSNPKPHYKPYTCWCP